MAGENVIEFSAADGRRGDLDNHLSVRMRLET
jgi:hypothetical protein